RRFSSPVLLVSSVSGTNCTMVPVSFSNRSAMGRAKTSSTDVYTTTSWAALRPQAQRPTLRITTRHSTRICFTASLSVLLHEEAGWKTESHRANEGPPEARNQIADKRSRDHRWPGTEHPHSYCDQELPFI